MTSTRVSRYATGSVLASPPALFAPPFPPVGIIAYTPPLSQHTGVSLPRGKQAKSTAKLESAPELLPACTLPRKYRLRACLLHAAVVGGAHCPQDATLHHTYYYGGCPHGCRHHLVVCRSHCAAALRQPRWLLPPLPHWLGTRGSRIGPAITLVGTLAGWPQWSAARPNSCHSSPRLRLLHYCSCLPLPAISGPPVAGYLVLQSAGHTYCHCGCPRRRRHHHPCSMQPAPCRCPHAAMLATATAAAVMPAAAA